jgi:hypothetical protein
MTFLDGVSLTLDHLPAVADDDEAAAPAARKSREKCFIFELTTFAAILKVYFSSPNTSWPRLPEPSERLAARRRPARAGRRNRRCGC